MFNLGAAATIGLVAFGGVQRAVTTGVAKTIERLPCLFEGRTSCEPMVAGGPVGLGGGLGWMRAAHAVTALPDRQERLREEAGQLTAHVTGLLAALDQNAGHERRMRSVVMEYAPQLVMIREQLDPILEEATKHRNRLQVRLETQQALYESQHRALDYVWSRPEIKALERKIDTLEAQIGAMDDWLPNASAKGSAVRIVAREIDNAAKLAAEAPGAVNDLTSLEEHYRAHRQLQALRTRAESEIRQIQQDRERWNEPDRKLRNEHGAYIYLSKLAQRQETTWTALRNTLQRKEAETGASLDRKITETLAAAPELQEHFEAERSWKLFQTRTTIAISELDSIMQQLAAARRRERRRELLEAMIPSDSFDHDHDKDDDDDDDDDVPWPNITRDLLLELNPSNPHALSAAGRMRVLDRTVQSLARDLERAELSQSLPRLTLDPTTSRLGPRNERQATLWRVGAMETSLSVLRGKLVLTQEAIGEEVSGASTVIEAARANLEANLEAATGDVPE